MPQNAASCADQWIFARGGGGGGGGGSGWNARKQLWRCFFFCFLVLNLFYSFTVVYQWFISKKTINFQSFRRGPTFSREGGGGHTFFRGRGGGLNANLYRNP